MSNVIRIRLTAEAKARLRARIEADEQAWLERLQGPDPRIIGALNLYAGIVANVFNQDEAERQQRLKQ